MKKESRAGIVWWWQGQEKSRSNNPYMPHHKRGHIPSLKKDPKIVNRHVRLHFIYEPAREKVWWMIASTHRILHYIWLELRKIKINIILDLGKDCILLRLNDGQTRHNKLAIYLDKFICCHSLLFPNHMFNLWRKKEKKKSKPKKKNWNHK